MTGIRAHSREQAAAQSELDKSDGRQTPADESSETRTQDDESDSDVDEDCFVTPPTKRITANKQRTVFKEPGSMPKGIPLTDNFARHKPSEAPFTGTRNFFDGFGRHLSVYSFLFLWCSSGRGTKYVAGVRIAIVWYGR